MAAKTARNLLSVGGGITVNTTTGSRVLVFSTAQTLKPGATIYISDGTSTEKLTIDSGSGVNWTTAQPVVTGGKGRGVRGRYAGRAAGVRPYPGLEAQDPRDQDEPARDLGEQRRPLRDPACRGHGRALHRATVPRQWRPGVGRASSPTGATDM